MAQGSRAIASAGGLAALDTGPILGPAWTLSELRPVLASLHVLLANEYELKSITRGHTLASAVNRLREDYGGLGRQARCGRRVVVSGARAGGFAVAGRRGGRDFDDRRR